MTPEIISVLIIFGIAVQLFITEFLRLNVTALFVLATIALTGLITADPGNYGRCRVGFTHFITAINEKKSNYHKE